MAFTSALGTTDATLVGSTLAAGLATANLEHELTDAMTVLSVATGLVIPDVPIPPLVIIQGKVQQAANFKMSKLWQTRFVSTTSTILATDAIVVCLAAITITLLPAADVFGQTFNINNYFSGTLTIAADGSELINGDATVSLTLQYESLTVHSIGIGYIIL